LQRTGRRGKRDGGKKKIEVKLEGKGKKSKNGVEKPRDFSNLQRERQLQGDRSGEEKGTEERRKSR
jgi:hypothetical protein